jgi:two-component system sensor kinase FixL
VDVEKIRPGTALFRSVKAGAGRVIAWPLRFKLALLFGLLVLPIAAFMATTAGIFLLGLILCSLLGTLLIAPLGRVTDAAPVDVVEDGEVGRMSQAMDLMLRRLREQQTILASQSEASIEGILIVSTAGKVISHNRRFLELWAIAGSELGDLDAVAAAVAPRARDPEQARELFRHPPGQPSAAEQAGELALRDGQTFVYYVAKVTSAAGEHFGRGYYFRDVTHEKEAAAELRDLHRQLLEASRRAGMAEVATGVLHNVGNVLNSINVSATLAQEYLGKSRAPAVRRAGELFADLSLDPALGFSQHPKARHLAPFLIELSDVLAGERAQLGRELGSLIKNVDHVKHIVALQNAHAKAGGVFETAALQDVVEEAIQVYAHAFARHDIEIERALEPLPPFGIDRHRILQILLNLLANARHAVAENAGQKRVRIAVEAGDPGQARVVVSDNGIGIAAEDQFRIFAAGFSTRKDGHGFGLHTAALAAGEMGGTLGCHSAGAGTGARFTLELPCEAVRS